MNDYYGYARGSTTKQELTTEAQREKIEAHFAMLSRDSPELRFCGVFEDAGTSGFKHRLEDRKAGAELCTRLKPGDHVVFTRLDRGFRRAADALRMMDDWREREITVHFLDMLGIGIDSSKPAGRMMLQMHAIIAEYERELIRERTLAIIQHRKSKGLASGGCCPYGFKIIGPKGKRRIVPCPRERAEMIEIAEMRDERKLPFDRIWAAFLAQRKRRSRNGKEFAMDTIRKMYYAWNEIVRKEGCLQGQAHGEGEAGAAPGGQALQAVRAADSPG